MGYPKRNRAGGPGSSIANSNGRSWQAKYNPNEAPRSFWRGFGGTQSMAEPIHRKPGKPKDTFWNPPKRNGGRG